jgi:hypothetical protein
VRRVFLAVIGESGLGDESYFVFPLCVDEVVNPVFVSVIFFGGIIFGISTFFMSFAHVSVVVVFVSVRPRRRDFSVVYFSFGTVSASAWFSISTTIRTCPSSLSGFTKNARNGRLLISFTL